MPEVPDIEGLLQNMRLDSGATTRLSELVSKLTSPIDNSTILYRFYDLGFQFGMIGRATPATVKEVTNLNTDTPLTRAALEYFRIGSTIGAYIFVSKSDFITTTILYLKGLKLILEPIIGAEDAEKTKGLFEKEFWGEFSH